MELHGAIDAALDGGVHDVARRLALAIRAGNQGRHVLEIHDADRFDVALWAARTAAQCEVVAPERTQDRTVWPGPDHPLRTRYIQGHRRVTHRGHSFDVHQCAWWPAFGGPTVHLFLVGDEEDRVRELALEIAQVTTDLRAEVLVFDGGCWERDGALHGAVQRASLDDLVLQGDLLERIRADFHSFLGAREAFGEAGISWRRGALFLGPPGNGKTHCIRGLLRELGLPVLYVRAFGQEYRSGSSEGIKSVFDRARVLQPCVVVLEDLDSLVDANARAYLLNELDGLADNTGVITLASSNWPEKLDPALLERPSRFDRKYTFGLPAELERYRWLQAASTGSAPPLHRHVAERLAAATGGFSFAYLKELLVAGLMAWVEAGSSGPLDPHVEAQLEPLRAQLQPT